MIVLAAEDQSFSTLTLGSLTSGSSPSSAALWRTWRSSPAREVNANRRPSGDQIAAMPSTATCVEWRRARSTSHTPVESVSELAATMERPSGEIRKLNIEDGTLRAPWREPDRSTHVSWRSLGLDRNATPSGDAETPLPSASDAFTQVPGGEAGVWRLTFVAVVISVIALMASEALSRRARVRDL